MKKIFSYFLQGLLYIVPLAVTIYVIYAIVAYADSFFDHLNFLGFGHIPGLGLIAMFFLICLIGYFGPTIISTPFAKLASTILNKAPLIRVIYSSVKELMNAFVGKERKFGTPVIVSLDDANILYRIGFITSQDLTNIGITDKIAVCFPNSYGLLAELVLVPTDKVKPLNANSADVMKFIVSGGVTSFDTKDGEQNA